MLIFSENLLVKSMALPGLSNQKANSLGCGRAWVSDLLLLYYWIQTSTLYNTFGL